MPLVVLARSPERTVRRWRWLIVAGWISLVASLFIFPDGPGLKLWWMVAIPAAILCFLVLGHDTWRRLCPLSAINQIPRLLGIGRTTLVAQDSWLARHALCVQFGLLTACVTLRLSLLNQSPFALGCFLVAVMIAALLVGFLAGGKTWCHYVCPMAPVQMVYNGPSSLLTTGAAAGGSGPGVSQSMCRNGRDEPICVACNAPCPDIDLEKNYWDRLATTERRIVIYGYLGLVAGFVIHVRLDLDKLLAAPVLLAGIAGAVILGWAAEWLVGTNENTRHRLLTGTTILAFVLLIGLGLLPTLPEFARLPVTAAATAAIALWSWQAWSRSRGAWQRSTLAGALRRRLSQLPLDLTPHLGGRTLAELSADEVGVLATVVPGLNADLRHRLYQNVLGDAAAAGQLDSSVGKNLLSGLRSQLGIDEAEHRALVAALPAVESMPRIESYRQAVERLVLGGLAEGEALATIIERQRAPLAHLRTAYSISDQEQEQVLTALTSGEGLIGRAGLLLVAELSGLSADRAALTRDGADGILRDHLTEQGHILAGQLAGIAEALGPDTAAGKNLQLAIAGAAIDRDLVPAAGGVVTPSSMQSVRDRLAESDEPLVAEAARYRNPRSKPSLKLSLGGRTAVVQGATARIGRDPGSDLVVNHPLASRHHAIAGVDDQGLWIEDCGSANGLFLDGRLLHGTRERLRSGALIRFGSDGPELTVATTQALARDRLSRFLQLRDSALGALPRSVVWELSEVAEQQRPAPDDVLIHAGQAIEQLWVVVAGEARTVIGEREVGYITPGETIGELGLITGDRAMATVKAGVDCIVLIIPGARIASLASRHPQAAVALLAMTSRRLARTLGALDPDPERTLC